jgi:hypothetical protein
MRISRLNIFGTVLLVVGFFHLSPSFAETRIALVIGNGAYQNVPRLANPANDAKAVAAALRRSGFDTIIATDLDEHGMEDAAIRFSRAARSADVALFYYSGHALQYNGVNYLAPVDTVLSDESDLRRMTRVNEIAADLEQAKLLRIMVLDSCRDNPFAEQLRRAVGTSRALPLGRGLAKLDAPQGMIMAYATQAGHTAEDGLGDNSPYTAAFLKHIEEQNEIGTIFREVSEDVYESTKHSQLPELSLSIVGQFYLRGSPVLPAPAASGTPVPAPPIRTTSSDFDAAADVDTVAGWEAFLKQHPDGLYADLARQRKTIIEKTQSGSASRETASLASPAEKLESPRAATDLSLALQTELRRVGCDTGTVESGWNATAREAIERFNRYTGMQLDIATASADALDVVKGKTGRVCPLMCGQGFKPNGEVCVKVECGVGSHLSSGNECERDKRGNDRKGPSLRALPAEKTQPDVEGTAGAMQRADHAQNAGNYAPCMGALPGCYDRALKRMSPDQARSWCSRKPTC